MFIENFPLYVFRNLSFLSSKLNIALTFKYQKSSMLNIEAASLCQLKFEPYAGPLLWRKLLSLDFDMFIIVTPQSYCFLYSNHIFLDGFTWFHNYVNESIPCFVLKCFQLTWLLSQVQFRNQIHFYMFRSLYNEIITISI